MDSVPNDTQESNDKSGGWFRLPNEITDRIGDVGHLAFAAYCVLARHADAAGQCWPSVPRIARCCGCSDRAVQGALRRLVGAGLVEIAARHGDRGQTSNGYTLRNIPPVNPVNVASPGEPGFTGGVNVASPAPVNVASPRTRPSKNKTQGSRREPAADAAAPADLLAYIDCWNQNCPEAKRTRRDPPTAAVLRGWQRVGRESELREKLADLEALGVAIRKAEWARGEPWFSAESLFERDSGKTNWKITKLLRGDYDGSNGHARNQMPGRGKFDAARPITAAAFGASSR